MKKLVAILLIVAIPLIQGCAVGILAAGVGYAVSSGRKGTAAQMEAKSKYLERYNTYKLGMEQINLEREKAKLEPRPILEFDAWLDEQPLTPEEQKLFKKTQAQTPKEYKAQEESSGKATSNISTN
jgi:hypothetical protein